MSFPTRLIAKLKPWATPDFERYLKAAGKPYEQVEEITEETGVHGKPGWVPPYGKVFNPETTPYKLLAWLGQFVGVSVKKTATEAEARAEVKAVSGFHRGTRASLETLLKKALGATSFILTEREPTPYKFQVVIPTGHLTNSVYEAINETIPAGIFYEVIEASNTWAAGTKKWEAIAAAKKWSEMTEGQY